MEEQDRIFLRDFVNLTYKNRLMTVEALFLAGQDGRRIAARTLRRVDRSLSLADSEALEAETNEGARFQNVMLSKILAEYVAALEDLGGLGHAVRYRATHGLLRRYFASGVGDAASFFDCVLQDNNATVAELLQLPSVESLTGILSEPDRTRLEAVYTALDTQLRLVARSYREPPVPGGTAGLAPLREDWRACVHILIGTTDATPSTRGLLPRTFNKVKHRFAVLESVEEHAGLSASSEFEVVAVDKRDERVAQLVDATSSVSVTACRLAEVLQFLDSHGVSL